MIQFKDLLNLPRGEVEAAIRKGTERLSELDEERQRLLAYLNICRQILNLSEANAGPSSPPPSVVSHTARTGKRAGKGRSGIRTVDAAFDVLSQADGAVMDGRKLLTALRRRGCKIGGARPMQSLSAMLRRDGRFVKVPNQENVWTTSLARA